VRTAPPVSLSCPRAGLWRALLVALPAVAAGVGAVWALQHLSQPLALALLPALLVGLWAWRSAPADPVHLAWDGTQWLADGEAGELAPMLDLHAAMLLRWRSPTRKTIWLPVSVHATGPAWHALRVAVYARRPAAQPPVNV
jgi:hypothetical protein